MNFSQPQLEQTNHCSPHHHHHRHCRHHHHDHHHHHHHHIHSLSHSSLHHHRHHHFVPHCALRNQFSQNPNLNFCSNLINPISQNSQPIASAPPLCEAAHSSHQIQTLQDDNLEESQDEEEDPIFVMTDEWIEFFAKSEARRREAKKLAKKLAKKKRENMETRDAASSTLGECLRSTDTDTRVGHEKDANANAKQVISK